MTYGFAGKVSGLIYSVGDVTDPAAHFTINVGSSNMTVDKVTAIAIADYINEKVGPRNE